MKLHKLLCVGFLCLPMGVRQGHSQTVQQILSSAATAFSHGKPVNSITLTGTATWIAGSDKESGNATLTANADGSFTVQLALDKGIRSEAQTSFTSSTSCTFTGIDAVVHASSEHNCLSNLAWFLPDVAVFGGKQPSFVLTLLTADNNASQPFIHLRQQQVLSSLSVAAGSQFLAHLSTVNFYLDPSSYLLSVLDYDIHPDNNAGVDIPEQVIFTDYRAVNGVNIPFRIERYINGVLNLDLTVTQASAN